MAALTPAGSSMKRVSLPATICRRALHTTASRQGSPFFALAALSNSRETNHLSKLSKLSRVQHSPSLQLIQSSEVLPFAPPAPPQPVPSSAVETTPKAAPVASKTQGLKDTDLLSVGRAILAEKNAEITRLRKELEHEKDRSTKREASYTIARQKSRERIQRLSEDVSSARTWKWIFLVLGGSVAAWTYTRDDVKRAWSISIGNDTPKVKAVLPQAQQSTPPPIAPVAERALPVVEAKVVKPAPGVLTPTRAKEASSWSSIFWARS